MSKNQKNMSKGKGKGISQPRRKKSKNEMLEEYLSGEYRQTSLHIRSDDATLSDRHRVGLDDSSSDEDINVSRPVAHTGSLRGDPSSHGTRGETSEADGGTADDTVADTGDLSAVRRRGEARDHSPGPSIGKKEIYFFGDVLLGDDMSGFFRPKIRKLVNDFYPQWSDVKKKVRDEIWRQFLKHYSLGQYEPDLVYNKFMDQNGEKFRKFLHELKRESIKKYKVSDVAELLDKPKPSFMKSDDIWKQYVRHWSTPEQRARSVINARNRASRKGMSHGYGRKSVAARMHEKQKEGNPSPFFNVAVEVNMKRDAGNKPTGEVHHEAGYGNI